MKPTNQSAEDREVLAALDQNDLLALLRESLPEDEYAVLLTREEAEALIHNGPLDPWRVARAKLEALLSNPESEE